MISIVIKVNKNLQQKLIWDQLSLQNTKVRMKSMTSSLKENLIATKDNHRKHRIEEQIMITMNCNIICHRDCVTRKITMLEDEGEAGSSKGEVEETIIIISHNNTSNTIVILHIDTKARNVSHPWIVKEQRIFTKSG